MLHRNRYSLTGFSMIEIMVVLIVLAIAGTVVVAMASNTDEMKVEAVVQQLASTLSYAQNVAIVRQEAIQVVFDSAAESYEVVDAAGAAIGGNVTEADGLYSMSFGASSEFGRADITSVNFDGGSVVWFDRMGGPHSGVPQAGPALASGTVVIGYGDASATLGVAPVTGTITVN